MKVPTDKEVIDWVGEHGCIIVLAIVLLRCLTCCGGCALKIDSHQSEKP